MKKKILTAVFVYDKTHKSFTGFIKEIPALVSRGSSIKDAEQKLFSLITDLDEFSQLSDPDEFDGFIWYEKRYFTEE